MSHPTPLTVIGGYLGAGKTTVVNEILRGSPDRRIAVLVNDFGEIAIDAALIESDRGTVVTLANGCVCCSLAGGFLVALQEVAQAEPPVDHIVVEASGVSDPRKIAQWGHTPGLTLDGTVVVVDAEMVRNRATDRYVGETVVNQIKGADLILCNKADTVDSTDPVRAWLASCTPAPVVDSVRGQVPLDVVLGPLALVGSALDPSVEPHAEHVRAAITIRRPVSRDQLDRWMADAPTAVLRAKGIVRLADAPDQQTVVQIVGHRCETSTAGPWIESAESQMVAIFAPGTDKDVVKSWLSAL